MRSSGRKRSLGRGGVPPGAKMDRIPRLLRLGWLALCAARHQTPVDGQLLIGEWAIELQVEVEAPQTERVREEELGIQAR